MYSDENKSSSLARFLNTFDYTIIDTCSLMDEAFPEWMDVLKGAKFYLKNKKRILVHWRCYDELKKHAKQRRDDSRRIEAKRGLKILKHAKWRGLLVVTKKNKNENFADNAIYVKVCADRLTQKILVITQDKGLASDCLGSNDLKSQNGKPVTVCKFVSGGRLVPNTGEGVSPRERKPHGTAKPGPKPTSNPTPREAEAIVLADARLSAVINNPNYPVEKKKADAASQLAALRKLPASVRSQINLLVDEATLTKFAGAVASKPAPKKPEPKPEPKPEEKPSEPQAPAKEKLWYGKGPNYKDALVDCASHYKMVFHEPTVVYFPEGHGPLDLSTTDLDAIATLAESKVSGEDRVSFTYRGMHLFGQKTEYGFKAWSDVNTLPKKLHAVRAPRKAADKPEPEKPVEEQPASSPKKKPAPKAKPEATEPVKTEPAPEEKPAKTRKKAQKPTQSEEKPAETPVKEEAPEAAKPKRKNAKPKAEEAPSEEAPKPEEAPKKRAPKKKATPAPSEEAPVDEAVKKIQAADRRLRANLSNPNYALENKIRDAKAQRAAIAELSPEVLATLKYGIKELDEWLAANQGE